MCQHSAKALTARNAVVTLRQALGASLLKEGPLGASNKEFSRQENYYDWVMEELGDKCPWCESLVFQPPEYASEIEANFEEALFEDVLRWQAWTVGR